ncbi:MAG: hypothetical protein JNG86_05380 [Verrucomicrobiaceae bacterium]|nr:hypothetical protein [Verrucomicrobiaceae bacterium]
MPSSFPQLRQLLQQRLDIIADHAFRDRDPAAHLAALQDVSERLAAEHARLRDDLPPRLHHFLTQSSLTKALEYLDASGP